MMIAVVGHLNQLLMPSFYCNIYIMLRVAPSVRSAHLTGGQSQLLSPQLIQLNFVFIVAKKEKKEYKKKICTDKKANVE